MNSELLGGHRTRVLSTDGQTVQTRTLSCNCAPFERLALPDGSVFVALLELFRSVWPHDDDDFLSFKSLENIHLTDLLP